MAAGGDGHLLRWRLLGNAKSTPNSSTSYHSCPRAREQPTEPATSPGPSHPPAGSGLTLSCLESHGPPSGTAPSGRGPPSHLQLSPVFPSSLPTGSSCHKVSLSADPSLGPLSQQEAARSSQLLIPRTPGGVLSWLVTALLLGMMLLHTNFW